ncbi:MAG: amidohydrolase [Gemmatimonadota bacterium]
MTMVPAASGDSIFWTNGRVVEVGSGSDIARRIPAGTPEFDFPDAIITPGFVDSHTHFVQWALGRNQVQLAGAGSRIEAVARVATGVPVQGWVIGQGWDANHWSDPPTRWALDAVQMGPVYLDSLDVHAAWVNSAGLTAAGITRSSRDPDGGRIVRDSSGEPTGLLLERAVELMLPVLPVPPLDVRISAVLEAQKEAHRLGITGIHNVEGHAAYQPFSVLDQRGQLRLRVLFHHPVADLADLVGGGIRSGEGSAWLTEGGIKMFLDGSLGSRTAWMLEPYEGSRDRGMAITSESMASQAMQLAAENGIASVVHAIGDAAVRRALTLMEGLSGTAIRHRIEHFQCVHPQDLERAARAGIVLSMQPAHILTDIPLAERHWGARSAGAYAFRSLLNTGAVLAFGSDTPVASIDPRDGVFAAMSRSSEAITGSWFPEERLDLSAVIRAYTAAPAFAAGLDDRRGTLAPGMDADLVVWQTPAEVERADGSAFRAGHVALTAVNGEVVYLR